MPSRKLLRSRNRSIERADAGPRHNSRLDAWLGRTASLSQPLLLVLAGFGYFYTVVPVYQKEVLSEQIAAKEVELGRLQRQINASVPTMQQLQSAIAHLKGQITALSAQKSRAEKVNAELVEKQGALVGKNLKLESQITSLASQAASVEARANEFSMRTYHDSFSASVDLQYIARMPNAYELVKSPSYELVRDYLLTPYAAVSSTLAQGDSKYIESASKVPRAVKDEYHRRVLTVIESHKAELSKPQDDVNALLLQIEQQMRDAAVDPTPDDHYNELKYETTSRLAKVLHESRDREWKRTRELLESLTPLSSVQPLAAAHVER